MDTTRDIEELLDRLAGLDPAEAPEPAAEVGELLAAELTESGKEEGES